MKPFNVFDLPPMLGADPDYTRQRDEYHRRKQSGTGPTNNQPPVEPAYVAPDPFAVPMANQPPLMPINNNAPSEIDSDPLVMLSMDWSKPGPAINEGPIGVDSEAPLLSPTWAD